MKKPCHWKLQDALSLLSRAYAGTSFGDDTADWEGGRVMRGTCVLAAFASSLRLVSLLQVCVCCNVPRQGSFPLTLLTGFLIPHFTVSWQHIQNFFSNLMWQTCCQSSDPKNHSKYDGFFSKWPSSSSSEEKSTNRILRSYFLV